MILVTLLLHHHIRMHMAALQILYHPWRPRRSPLNRLLHQRIVVKRL